MAYIILLIITIPLAYTWQILEEKGQGLIIQRDFLPKYSIGLKKNAVRCLAFFPLFFLYAFQYSLHSDYDNYYKAFWGVKNGTSQIREIGVHYINKLVAVAGLDFQFVYIIIYLIAFTILAKCIIDYSSDYALSLVLFITVFFTLGFLQIRQFVAVTICFYSYRYIYSGNFLKFFLCIVVSCLFHISALIMLPAYIVLRYRFKFSYYLVASGFFAFINLFKVQVLTWIVKNFIPSYYGRHEMFRNLGFNKWDTILLALIVFLSIIYFSRVEQKKDVNIVFFNGLFIYVILFSFGRWIIEFDRFGYYFYFPLICLLPNMLKEEQNIYFKILLKAVLMVTLIIFFVIKHHSSELFIYESILFKN